MGEGEKIVFIPTERNLMLYILSSSMGMKKMGKIVQEKVGPLNGLASSHCQASRHQYEGLDRFE